MEGQKQVGEEANAGSGITRRGLSTDAGYLG